MIHDNRRRGSLLRSFSGHLLTAGSLVGSLACSQLLLLLLLPNVRDIRIDFYTFANNISGVHGHTTARANQRAHANRLMLNAILASARPITSLSCVFARAPVARARPAIIFAVYRSCTCDNAHSNNNETPRRRK